MGIRFQCHHCGHQLHVKDFQAGKKGRCPQCKGPFRVPQSDAQFSLDPNTKLDPSETPQAENSYAHQSASEVRGNATARPSMAVAKGTEIATQTKVVGTESLDQPTSEVDQLQPRVISESPEATWYVRPASGGQYGPAPASIVWEWLIEDRIGHDSLVWREDWPEWLSANQVFADFFNSASESQIAQHSIQPQASAPMLSELEMVGLPQQHYPSYQPMQANGLPSNMALAPNNLTYQPVPQSYQQTPPNFQPAPQAYQPYSVSPEISPGDTTAASQASGQSSRATNTRDLRKRSRRMKYSVAISVLAVVLITLAIGLVVVLYQQNILGGSPE
jgi:hypothetical protein